jgi:hypothetical protein
MYSLNTNLNFIEKNSVHDTYGINLKIISHPFFHSHVIPYI